MFRDVGQALETSSCFSTLPSSVLAFSSDSHQDGLIQERGRTTTISSWEKIFPQGSWHSFWSHWPQSGHMFWSVKRNSLSRQSVSLRLGVGQLPCEPEEHLWTKLELCWRQKRRNGLPTTFTPNAHPLSQPISVMLHLLCHLSRLQIAQSFDQTLPWVWLRGCFWVS